MGANSEHTVHALPFFPMDTYVSSTHAVIDNFGDEHS